MTSKQSLERLAAPEAFLPASTMHAWHTMAPFVPESAYLSGGTGLAVHLHHRISRDLDFFTEEPFDVEALAADLNSAGPFAATMMGDGTLNGVFEETKVQFLEADQRLLRPTSRFGGVRLASLEDIAASKLKVIQDSGALRDYFDLMQIDPHAPMEEALTLLVEKYQPMNPVGLIANVVRGLDTSTTWRMTRRCQSLA